ncbi:MAG TPA: DUF3445 domain-containing protein [Trebonia sp.]
MTAVEPDTEGFPFPLVRDAYRYTANLSPVLVSGDGGTVLNAGREYEEFVAERARVLARVPDMLVRAPHLLPAEWDTLLFLMRRLTAERPADFGLRTAEGRTEEGHAEPEHAEAGRADAGRGGAGRFGHGERVRWENRRLGMSLEFTIGDEDSLPCGPLEYIGRQVMEDLVLLDTRDGHLRADAGLVSFASSWSFPFVAGMAFQEIHTVVPRAMGVFERAEAFLLRLPPGDVYQRVNWTFQPGRVLDRSMDSHARWKPDAERFLRRVREGDVGDAEFGAHVRLRVEVQHLVALETSGAVLFLIDTRFLRLADLARIPEWARRTVAVLEELPGDMASYKGLTDLRPRILAYLDEAPRA